MPRKSKNRATALAAPAPGIPGWVLGVGALGVLWAITRKKEGAVSDEPKPVIYSDNNPDKQKAVEPGSIKTMQIFGDSQMEVLGPPLVRGLAAKGITASYVFNRGWTLSNYENRDTYNTGSASNKPGMPNDLKLGHITADAVMVQLGTNEANSADASGKPTPPSAGQLDNQYKRLRVLIGNRPLIWVGPARFGTAAAFPSNAAVLNRVNRPEALAVADSIRDLADSYGFKFIDSREFVTSGWYDGIHFNTSVYTTWASGILARL